MDKLTITTVSPSETQDLGRWIGQRLEPGSIIALIGELGCGKTCFTQGLCSGLDISTRYVNSPTFTFINEYSGRLPVLHFDLYRVEDMDTVLEIGALDSLSRAEQGVAVIEWAERVSPLLQGDRLEARFTVLSSLEREIRLIAVGERFQRLLGELAKR
jgi:tRNA threonylcarbamoyladenosine biosynthesis protein TsaE